MPILENGHLTLLEDPEIRAIAARYGDPDRWLTQVLTNLRENFGEGSTDA